MNAVDQTLDQLEGVDWGPPTYDSYVVRTAHRLRKKPLRDFTPEDLRFMIGQQISLPILMPLALDVLEIDPFAGGEMHPGVLIEVALRVNAGFWQGHPELWGRMHVVVADIYSMKKLLDQELLPAAKAFESARPQS